MFDLRLKREIDLLKDQIESKKQWSLEDYLEADRTPGKCLDFDSISY